MPAHEVAIRSERVLTDRGLTPGTIHIRDGRILDVSGAPDPSALDLGELVLMPGVIDAHVHINEPGRTDWEGFHTAGRAAAAGGVTTIIVMPLNCTPAATTVAALEAEARAATGTCLVDFGLWAGVVPGNAEQLRPLWDAGALGFKCFLVHSGVDDFPNVTEADLHQAMPLLGALAAQGAPLLVHAEDPASIEAARGSSGLERSPRSYQAYLASRPPAAEERAIELMIRLCRRYRGRVHIVHVSAASALPALSAAGREGLPISSETCPHYLTFAAEEIGDGRTEFKCAPPIRDRANLEALWTGLGGRELDLIGSDHSPCPPAMKKLERGDFAAAWGGISSLQLTLPAIWTGASRRGFTLQDVSRWLSGGPARLAGVEASKGRIAAGLDADLIAFDPDAEWTVHAAALHHRHTLTPYDRLHLRGQVRATWVRGRQVFGAPGSVLARAAGLGRDGLATEATGQWVKRSRA